MNEFKTYKQAINPSLDWILKPFNDDKTSNPLFYIKRIWGLKNSLNNQIESDVVLSVSKVDLINVNNTLANIALKVVELFKCIEYFEFTSIESIEQNSKVDTFNRLQSEIIFSINNLKLLIPDITYIHVKNKNFALAFDVQNHLRKTIQDHLFFISRLGIKINKTPLIDNYNDLLKTIENSIDFETLKIINSLNNQNDLQPKPIIDVEVKETKDISNKLSINQIALIHIYKNIRITEANANENKLLKENNLNSGKKLYQQYNYYSILANRKGEPKNCTLKIITNKIKLFESVKLHLNESENLKLIDEIKMLQTILENKY